MSNTLTFARLVSQITALSGRSLSNDEIAGLDTTVSGFTGAASINGINGMLGAMRNGMKIEAIKEYRALTGMPLKESKDAIEAYWTYQEQHARSA